MSKGEANFYRLGGMEGLVTDASSRPAPAGAYSSFDLWFFTVTYADSPTMKSKWDLVMSMSVSLGTFSAPNTNKCKFSLMFDLVVSN